MLYLRHANDLEARVDAHISLMKYSAELQDSVVWAQSVLVIGLTDTGQP